ncbi:MAG: hypothetical protein M1816_005118 [Peltula sp. TS41687]|nr:MAG: hypothetical protein M1816_005118 [Peltula sp. TS41687]
MSGTGDDRYELQDLYKHLIRFHDIVGVVTGANRARLVFDHSAVVIPAVIRRLVSLPRIQVRIQVLNRVRHQPGWGMPGQQASVKFVRDRQRDLQKTGMSRWVGLMLKKPGSCFEEASAGETVKAKAAGPWGSKPNHMANGQDFFVQLRKGMATLQHSANQPNVP